MHPPIPKVAPVLRWHRRRHADIAVSFLPSLVPWVLFAVDARARL